MSPHALIITGLLLLLPVVLGVALWLFAEDHPRNHHDHDDTDTEGDRGADVRLAA